ncbi:diphthine methyltransferase isoform X1 [Spodoptera frugiperda]|nr:diphthine methyltransferase isoform X1 [Spodoptera frugiperda]XP_035432931.2 diphthine methyltransferase isoform X1 [Spodoptera frugiperda]
MAVWQNKWRWDTGYSADSVEWCPVEPYQDVLVCGTYQLDNTAEGNTASKQTRLGKIYLFVVNENTAELAPVHSIDTSGILDQKWCYHKLQNRPTLAVVTSVGTLQLYQLTNEDGVLQLALWIEHTICENGLALSVDWSTNKTHSDDPYLAVSDSAGCIHILKIVENCVKVVCKWESHSFEAWITAFNYWNSDVFYSGGDDCVFKSYDVRVPDVSTTVNKKHEAGVTSIRSHIDKEHQLLTGSYDEKVRLWDTRSLKCSVRELDVNGGVWRLKWHPSKPCTVLAACMYGGFRILRVNDEMEILSEYLEHESIAYGADWKCNSDLVATCSFYDCKMHISQILI